jgi:hypothetical protein
MEIEELVKHYQETGEYLPEAEKLENEHIRSNLNKLKEGYREYVNSQDFMNDDYPYNFNTWIDIAIGSWQAKVGFTRSFDKLILERNK